MDTKMLTKELAPIKAKVSQAISASNSLVIKKEEHLTPATELLGKIKTVGRAIKQKKETITKPLNEALRNARAFFNPIEKEYLEAERIVKSKMLEYQNAQIKKAEIKSEKIAEKVEAGEMSFDKAADKIEKVTPDKVIEAKESAVQFRTIKEVVIEDKTKIPREYLIPDMVRIRKIALAGVEIAGIKVVEKQTVAGLRR